MLRSLLCLIFATALVAARAATAPGIAIITDAPWSPADASREGAAEMDILLRLALLRQQSPLVGFVGIGDRWGQFQDGTRRGLEFAVLQGAPVVRLARNARTCPAPETDLFIDGGLLSAEAASALLTECLARHGPLPAVHSVDQPSSAELAALRRKVRLYQAEFSAKQAPVVAAR